MGMMKGNVAMMVPQSLIMGWINAFFSGYVISEFKLYSDRRGLRLMITSETAFPAHAAVQADASSRRGDQGPGCAMGEQPELVLFNALRAAACIQLHPREQQR